MTERRPSVRPNRIERMPLSPLLLSTTPLGPIFFPLFGISSAPRNRGHSFGQTGRNKGLLFDPVASVRPNMTERMPSSPLLNTAPPRPHLLPTPRHQLSASKQRAFVRPNRMQRKPSVQSCLAERCRRRGRWADAEEEKGDGAEKGRC